MKVSFSRLRRSTYAVLALAVAGSVTLPVFTGIASAAQVTDRYVKMSSAKTSASSVSYEIGFKVATAGAVQGVTVDFCSNSPIIGDTCTKPTGFSDGAGTTTGSITGMTGTWSGASANTNRTLVLSLGTPGGSAAANAQATFTVTTITNGSSVGAFYARIRTFATAANASSWVTNNPNGDTDTGSVVVDSGGVAMRTTQTITVTAKVQETLTFCVYTGGSCGTGSAVTLGDTNGVLVTTAPYVDKNTSYDIASNAATGVVVRFKAPLPTSGSNDIDSIGTTATAPSTANVELFGLCTYKASGTGALTATAPYNNAACNATTQTAGTGSTAGGVGSAQFAFNTANAASTYGEQMATMAAGDTTVGKVVFAAQSSVTTPAGIYTSPFDFIATGTY